MNPQISPHCPINPLEDARTLHFTLAEFHCKDGTPIPRQLRGNVQRLMTELEILRASFGHRPVVVTSGYRSVEHNARIGGAKKSQHLCGTAADIYIVGISPLEVADKIVQLIDQGKMMQGGVGKYRSFTHYDIRGKAARWGFTKKST